MSTIEMGSPSAAFDPSKEDSPILPDQKKVAKKSLAGHCISTAPSSPKRCAIFPPSSATTETPLSKRTSSSNPRSFSSQKVTQKTIPRPGLSFTEETALSLREEGLTTEKIKKINEWYLKNWSKVMTPKARSLVFSKKTSYLKGIKYVKDPETRKITIQIADSFLGKGGFKAAKRVLEISPDGSLKKKIRFGQVKTGDVQTLDSSDFSTLSTTFLKDITTELEFREQLQRLSREKKLQFPETITRLRRYTYVSAKTGKTKTRFVGELCAGTVSDLLFKKEKDIHGHTYSVEALNENFDEDLILKYYYDSLQGLEFIHECGGIHLDLKPENILQGFTGIGKLNDFGLATFGSKKGLSGTPGYIAPELFLEKKFTTKSDCFSYGMMFLELICFSDFLGLRSIQEILFDSYPHIQAADYRSFLTKLNQIRSNLRFSSHPLAPLVRNLLNPTPSKRLTASETRERLGTILSQRSIPI